ncbi:nuclease-related domain-containing protein [Bacillaceae bacterium CLA-AA-H227]|uniref:Nuclease-related domain-containing protein n=1 Tax=Robertmurraya yapensis (ex Hitch et al 2024) TaxID=3133160 RepID=A0ACC6SEJ8_9BACI
MILPKKMKGCGILIIAPRSESPELLIHRYLSTRNSLTEKEYQYYSHLEKGFEGEKKFDELADIYLKDMLFLKDLLLEQNNSHFQMDSLGCSKDGLYLFDIKNFEGDFIIEGDTWKTTTGIEIKNPYHQLTRCLGLLKKYLLERKSNISIKAFLIFINPQFTLYQASPTPEIILPTQLDRFLQKLQMDTSNPGTRYNKLIETILSDKLSHYPNSNIPRYEYSELLKGVFCLECRQVMIPLIGRRGKLVCSECAKMESIESIILRSVKEYKVLFPERKVTTMGMYDWCNGTIGEKTIQRHLQKNFSRSSRGKFSYYIN